MKIAMVSEHASPLAILGGVDAGGQNVHVAELAKALARRGHEVVVHTRRDDPDLPDQVPLAPGVVVDHVTAGPPLPVAKDDLLAFVPDLGRALARRWADQRPDVVHAHFWMSGLAAMVGTRDIDTPMVQTFHALGSVKRRHQGPRDTSPPQRNRLEQALGRGAAHVIATCSDEVVELLRMGVRRRAISIVTCGVDLAQFSIDGPTAPRGAAPRLLCVGRLVERKGIDTAIRALRRIPRAELLVAGGPDRAELGSDPEARRLLALAAECGVADRVRLLGRVGRDELPALLRSADVLISVPTYEPFGIVPLEAMACGLPVVASAVGGLLDTVVDGTTGAHVPPGRPEALADVLRHLLADPVRLQGYGLAGNDRVHARYTWERVALDTEAVYRGVRSHRGRIAGKDEAGHEAADLDDGGSQVGLDDIAGELTGAGR
jgi:glycosyltransferase involved in cell wall biosynthesis